LNGPNRFIGRFWAEDVKPNQAPAGGGYAVDVQVYTENWAQHESLYEEFRSKGAVIAVEPIIYEGGGPWATRLLLGS